MKAKSYEANDYVKLMEFCLLTTNLGEKSESILRSVYRKYVSGGRISDKQYEALHNIAIMCTEGTPEQTILRSLKFDGPPEPLPAFVLTEDGVLNYPKEKNNVQPTQEILSNDFSGLSQFERSDNISIDGHGSDKHEFGSSGEMGANSESGGLTSEGDVRGNSEEETETIN